jgi:hypothetical protein
VTNDVHDERNYRRSRLLRSASPRQPIFMRRYASGPLNLRARPHQIGGLGRILECLHAGVIDRIAGDANPAVDQRTYAIDRPRWKKVGAADEAMTQSTRLR